MAEPSTHEVNPQTIIVYGDKEKAYSSAYDEDHVEITILLCLARYGPESNPQAIEQEVMHE